MADKTLTATDNYLRFDAYSFKELIKQKLSEDPNFTDFIYDGSNLSVIVDLCSTLAQALMYNLNNSVSQVMFSDASVYENLSKICKFIGYNPRGYSAPEVLVTVNMPHYSSAGRYVNRVENLRIPCYSSITLDKTDRFGSFIKYSTTTFYDVYRNKNNGTNNVIRLVNGEWQKYPVDFVAEGIPYEKFILEDLVSDSTAENPTYVSYPNIHVWVKRRVNGKYTSPVQYTVDTRGTFTSNGTSDIYGSDDAVCMLRLNEFKQYEIQFGDAVHGKPLKAGDIVYVLYLRSNGPDGVIDVGEINDRLFSVGVGGCQQTKSDNDRELTIYDLMGGDVGMHSFNLWKYATTGTQIVYNDDLISYNANYVYYSVMNSNGSSYGSDEEGVESIRANAPSFFKSIGGVITMQNFEATIKSRFWSQLIDVAVMDNYDYCAKFYKWLERIGIETGFGADKFLNESLDSYSLYGYKYVEAANQNDIYIWIKSATQNSVIKDSIVSYLDKLKPLTARVNVCDAVEVSFDLCAGYISDTEKTLRTYYNGSESTRLDNFIWDDVGQNRLEVEIENNVTLSVQNLKETIVHTFRDFFNPEKLNIGCSVDMSQLTSRIMDITGVKNVRTVFRKYDSETGTYSTEKVLTQSGVSLAYWNPTIVNGYDIKCTTSKVMLEDFQFPKWNDFNSLADKIDIITAGSYNIVSVEKA